MSRVIIYSDYLNTNEKSHLINNLEYISTRDGVVLNLDDQSLKFLVNEFYRDKSITQKQNLLLKEILMRFPQVNKFKSYDEYKESMNMYTASKLIQDSMNYIKNHKNSNAIYMQYIGERPRVEIYQDELHGLFDINGIADIEKYKNEISNNDSIIYRHIISLKREDAETLGYDKRENWEKLLRAKAIVLGNAMGIPDNDFKWVAAFHNEGHHPHVHLMCWSESGKFGYLKEKDIEKFKSTVTNTIFDNEMWLLKELKNEFRNELEETFKEQIKEELKEIKESKIDSTSELEIYKKLDTISQKINLFGKKEYGYQKEETKILVNDLVADILNNEKIYPILTKYVSSQQSLIEMYKNDQVKIKEDINNFLNSIVHPGKNDRKVLHNIIIKSAYEFRDNTMKQIKAINDCMDLDLKILNQEQILSKYSVILSRFDIPIDDSITLLSRINVTEDEAIEYLFDAKHLDKQKKIEIVNNFFKTRETLIEQLQFEQKLLLDGFYTEKMKIPLILFSRLHTAIKDNTIEEKIAHFRRLNLIKKESKPKQTTISKYTN